MPENLHLKRYWLSNYAGEEGKYHRKYPSSLRAPYPQSPGISVSPTRTTPVNIASRRRGGVCTLYRLPPAPTLHRSFKYATLITITGIPQADIQAAHRPMSFAKIWKNRRTRRCEEIEEDAGAHEEFLGWIAEVVESTQR